MKKKILLGLFFSFILTISYGIEITKDDAQLIKIIEIGNGGGKLGRDYSGPPFSPTSFTISKDDLLYVFDYINNRIIVYDLQLNYIKEFSNKKKVEEIKQVGKAIKIDEQNNCIILLHSEGIVKLNNQGEKIFFITKNKLPKRLFSKKQFYPVHEDIFLFNNNELQYIDKNGIIKEEVETLNKLAIINNHINNKFPDNFSLSDKIKKFAQEKKCIFIDKIFITNNFEDYLGYTQILKDNIKSIKIKDKIDITIDDYSGKFLLGFDVNNNCYWQTYNDEVFVFSEYGELLHYFRQLISPKMALTKTGDIYIMDGTHELGIAFYKVPNTW